MTQRLVSSNLAPFALATLVAWWPNFGSAIDPPQRLPSPLEEVLPQESGAPAATPFPPLPPDPNEPGGHGLPPLDEELGLHGGAHLYVPEGNHAFWHRQQACAEKKSQALRLPETYRAPQPFTLFQDFLGADPIRHWPQHHWFGPEGYHWEPRFVLFGDYELLALAFEQGNDRQWGVGHQLRLDFDLRLTGTERFHLQYRPLGKKNSGGSFYQFNDGVGYIDNSTGTPDRFWFEGEFESMFRGLLGNSLTPRDYHVVVGRFPFALQNALLINDDITGIVINKNTILLPNLSNFNVQAFYAFEGIDAFDVNSNLVGSHLTADYRHTLIEISYARIEHSRDSSRTADYAAAGAVHYLGRSTVAARALFKWGDEGGQGDGQLYVIESNRLTAYDSGFLASLGIKKSVAYANAFYATPGWNPISGGNFDRLRSTFTVDPLVSVARGVLNDAVGVACGVQLFRHHEDESITPEVAWETPGGTSVIGTGIRYQRKTGARSFFELRALGAWSRDPTLERSGIFVSETILF